MGPTLTQALWLLPFVLPICLYVAWSDMQSMKIPNRSVVALVVVFAVIGLIIYPLTDYAWRWTHLVVVLVIGVVLNAAGALGAGDAKFAAAAAPLVAAHDFTAMTVIFGASVLAGYLAHRLVKHSPLRRMVPDWASWTAGRRFPMGLPLAVALVVYLALPLIARSGLGI